VTVTRDELDRIESGPDAAAVPVGETWELTPEEAVELESLMRAPRGAPGTLAHDPKPVPDVSTIGDLYAAARAYDAASEPEGAT